MVKLFCAKCGNDLRVSAGGKRISPCETCMKEHWYMGYEMGKKDGYQEGHDDGYDDGYGVRGR